MVTSAAWPTLPMSAKIRPSRPHSTTPPGSESAPSGVRQAVRLSRLESQQPEADLAETLEVDARRQRQLRTARLQEPRARLAVVAVGLHHDARQVDRHLLPVEAGGHRKVADVERVHQ